MKYLSHEHTTLVNKLLDENTQDLRKSLDEIKQQKIELNKDEGNSTNNRNENVRLNMILSEFNNFLSIDFCRVNNQFDVIKNKVQNAKKNNLQANQTRQKMKKH